MPEGAHWGELFALMESAHRQFHLEDYAVSANSLEDVFLLLSARASAAAAAQNL